MGEYTDKLQKRKKGPKPFGQGTAAMKVAVLDSNMETTVDQFVTAYAGADALHDMCDWLKEAPPNEKWLCEAPNQVHNLIVYLDPNDLIVLARETPKGKWLPLSHPCASFYPDASLKVLEDMIP